jgi:type IV pilus assembly protein PilC
MPKFSYTAFDVNGRERKGAIDAASADDVSAKLRSQGLFPTSLAEQAAKQQQANAATKRATSASASAGPKKPPMVIGSVISTKGLAIFTRQLSTLVQAGLPLLRSLEVLGRQEKNAAFKWVVDSLAENIRSGGTLSDGLLQHPKVFNKLFLNMVRAGEAGGKLDVVLGQLAMFMEKAERIKGKIKAAMIYPIIIITVAVLILVGLMMFVVPKFKMIFDDLLKGAPLPALTQLVLGVSDFVKNNILATIGIVALFVVAVKLLRRTKAGLRLMDRMVLRLPPTGDLFLKAAIARFTRTLGTLMSSGVPILQALLITRETSGNSVLSDAINVVHDRVKEGDNVAGTLEGTGVFPAMVTSMIEVGEETGQLPEMLTRIADTYDDEVDNAVAGLTSIIEPVMIVFLALIVGTIVIALFLPIVRIIQLLS